MTSKRAQEKAKRANDRRLAEALNDVERGRPDRALRSLNALVGRAPDNAQYQFEWAKVLELEGQLGGAVRGYRKVAELDPDYVGTEEALQRLDGVSPDPEPEPDQEQEQDTQPFGGGLQVPRQVIEWQRTVGPNWNRILEELDQRGIARAQALAPRDQREEGDLEALAAELHLRLAPLADDWARRLERTSDWPVDLASRRHTLQAWSSREVESPWTVEPPEPESPQHMPLHALVCLGPGKLELERADLRPGKKRAASIKLEPGDVGLVCAPRRPVEIANIPALQPVAVELTGEGRVRLLL